MPRGIFNPTLIEFVIFEGSMSNFVQNTKESVWTIKILIVQKIFFIISNAMLMKGYNNYMHVICIWNIFGQEL